MTDESRLLTADGLVLAHDLSVPRDAYAVAVLAHPHPSYGGNRHAVVVDPLFHGLPNTGVATLRFDFRGAGDSPGTHDGGVGEQLDLDAAIDAAVAAVPGVPVVLVGYSFGAAVVLASTDARPTARVAVAPPPALLTGAPAAPPSALLVVVGEHDTVAPLEQVEARLRDRSPAIVEIAGADHLFVGAASRIVAEVGDFIATLVR